MHAKIALGFLLIALTNLHGQEKPHALFLPHPTCFELAVTTNRYISLGEEGTVTELTRYWHEVRDDSTAEESAREHIGWICRLIFIPNGTRVLRSPMFGGLELPYNSFRGKDWPYYPLAESDGIFFVIAEGYSIAGLPEDPISYLAYCKANGRFRRQPLKIPTEEEARVALEHLVSSKVWGAIRWKDSDQNFSYEMSSTPVLEHLRAQTRKRGK